MVRGVRHPSKIFSGLLFGMALFSMMSIESNAMSTVSSTDGSLSKYGGATTTTYQGEFEQDDPNLITLHLERSSDNKEFSGLAATDRSKNFQYSDNLDSVLKKAGVANGVQELKDKWGVYLGSDGRWKMPDGTNLSVIDLGLLGVPGHQPPPSHTPTDTGGSDGCPYTKESHWVLTKVVGGAGGTNNGNSNRIRTGKTHNQETYGNVGYTNTGSLEYLFYNQGGWSGAWQRPYWTSLDVEFTATWICVEKKVIHHGQGLSCSSCPHCSYCGGDEYHSSHCSSHNHWTETIYTQIDEVTQTSATAYEAEMYYVDWIEEKPIDLTTEAAYNGTVTIANNHGYVVQNPIANSGSGVPISVSKTSFGAGEMLNLLSTNEPGEFFVDFGNSWFGIAAEENLDGGTSYKSGKSVGYQWVAWADMWYGGDHLQNDRAEKINTITKLNNASTAGTETVQSEHLKITSGNPYSGKYKFNMRSVYPTSSGSYYMLGEAGNNCWTTWFELDRNNLKGVDWKASASSSPNSLTVGTTREDYTKYVIWDQFRQPILYGQYDVKTPAAR